MIRLLKILYYLKVCNKSYLRVKNAKNYYIVSLRFVTDRSGSN